MKKSVFSFLSQCGVRGNELYQKSLEDPLATQKQFLFNLLGEQKNTAYGHGDSFGSIRSIVEFRKRIPVVKAHDLAPWIVRVEKGEPNVLTADPVEIFARSSGTTAAPKLIPYTQRGIEACGQDLGYWLYNAELSHARVMRHRLLPILAARVEGTTPKRGGGGMLFGSASGISFASLGEEFGRRSVLPGAISEIQDSALRYYAIARLALANSISFIATPGPLTLLRLYEVICGRREELVRSISDGTFSDALSNESDLSQIGLSISPRKLAPRPARGRFLDKVFNTSNKLSLKSCWPELKLVGCWLGGSIGRNSGVVLNCFDDTPKRDLGYMASEGIFSLPLSDESSAGVLNIWHNFFEFIPEEDVESDHPDILDISELEAGKNYKVIVTNMQGLYRYDMEDIVRVDDFCGNGLPVISFLRKAGSFLNMVGEKMHLNHFLSAMEKVEAEFDLEIRHFRVYANQHELRYEFLIDVNKLDELRTPNEGVVEALDRLLIAENLEYRSKRESGRLNAPVLHLMLIGWAEELRKQGVASVSRDIQWKWPHLVTELSSYDKQHIGKTI